MRFTINGGRYVNRSAERAKPNTLPRSAHPLPADAQPEMTFSPHKVVSGIPIRHQPTYYLTEEACQRRISALIDRIARDGLKPGEAVPNAILAAADIRRGELRGAA
jgi:hypothetical protein